MESLIQDVKIVVSYHPGKEDAKLIATSVKLIGKGIESLTPKDNHPRQRPTGEGYTRDEALSAVDEMMDAHGTDTVIEYLNHGTDLKTRAGIRPGGDQATKTTLRDTTTMWIAVNRPDLHTRLQECIKVGGKVKATFLDNTYTDNMDEVDGFMSPSPTLGED